MRDPIAVLWIMLLGCTEYEYVRLDTLDTFVQADADQGSDVLFVVDDSASMAEEQDLLTENFGTLVDVLMQTDADFQIGVVSTTIEGPNAGFLRAPEVSSDDPDLLASVVEALNVGTEGSRDERGLEAAALALDGRNLTFPRAEARVHVVIFSDEDDHSSGEVSEWVDGMSAALGPTAIHGVTGDLPDGCASGRAAADPGLRYREASELSSGFSESICVTDYGEMLTHLGFELVGLYDTFYLSRVPEPESIEVWVDDVLMHPRDLDGWTYAPGDNAIVFDGRAIPRSGMGIEVKYRLLTGAASVVTP